MRSARGIMVDGEPLYVIIPTVLVIGFALAAAAKSILGPRSRLSFTASAIIGMLGAAVAGAMAHAGVLGRMDLVSAWLLAVVGTVLMLALAEHLVAAEPPGVAELIAAGESGGIEFKSTARHNVRTGLRDDAIELVIAKTVAGFLNSGGGTLLIGVADDGAIHGLDDDLQHMKSADFDRFELWVRDYLCRTLGAAAAALVDVSFPCVEGGGICRLDIAASPRPVYVRPTKSDGVQFCVRIGNATRALPVDQAVSYTADHFGKNLARPLRRVRV